MIGAERGPKRHFRVRWYDKETGAIEVKYIGSGWKTPARQEWAEAADWGNYDNPNPYWLWSGGTAPNEGGRPEVLEQGSDNWGYWENNTCREYW